MSSRIGELQKIKDYCLLAFCVPDKNGTGSALSMRGGFFYARRSYIPLCIRIRHCVIPGMQVQVYSEATANVLLLR